MWHTCASEGRTIECEVFRLLKRPVTADYAFKAYEMPSTTVVSVFHVGIVRSILNCKVSVDKAIRNAAYILSEIDKR